MKVKIKNKIIKPNLKVKIKNKVNKEKRILILLKVKINKKIMRVKKVLSQKEKNKLKKENK